MKPNKSIPSVKGRASAKATPTTQGSKNLKAAPSVKNSPGTTPAPTRQTQRVKVVTQGAAPPRVQAAPSVAHSPAEVALRAYHNFQKRGSADGDHTGDWLRAEAELSSERRLVHA